VRKVWQLQLGCQAERSPAFCSFRLGRLWRSRRRCSACNNATRNSTSRCRLRSSLYRLRDLQQRGVAALGTPVPRCIRFLSRRWCCQLLAPGSGHGALWHCTFCCIAGHSLGRGPCPARICAEETLGFGKLSPLSSRGVGPIGRAWFPKPGCPLCSGRACWAQGSVGGSGGRWTKQVGAAPKPGFGRH